MGKNAEACAAFDASQQLDSTATTSGFPGRLLRRVAKSTHAASAHARRMNGTAHTLQPHLATMETSLPRAARAHPPNPDDPVRAGVLSGRERGASRCRA